MSATSQHHLKHAALALLVTYVILLVLTIGWRSVAAQTLSEGCQWLNRPSYDNSYMETTLDPLYFVSGEQIAVTAGPPSEDGSPGVVVLLVNNEPVDSASYPAILSYTIPADGSYSASWGVEEANVMWSVGCDQAADPLSPTATTTTSSTATQTETATASATATATAINTAPSTPTDTLTSTTTPTETVTSTAAPTGTATPTTTTTSTNTPTNAPTTANTPMPPLTTTAAPTDIAQVTTTATMTPTTGPQESSLSVYLPLVVLR